MRVIWMVHCPVLIVSQIMDIVLVEVMMELEEFIATNAYIVSTDIALEGVLFVIFLLYFVDLCVGGDLFVRFDDNMFNGRCFFT